MVIEKVREVSICYADPASIDGSTLVVTEWANGKGYTASINAACEDNPHYFPLSHADYDALVKAVSALRE